MYRGQTDDARHRPSIVVLFGGFSKGAHVLFTSGGLFLPCEYGQHVNQLLSKNIRPPVPYIIYRLTHTSV